MNNPHSQKIYQHQCDMYSISLWWMCADEETSRNAQWHFKRVPLDIRREEINIYQTKFSIIIHMHCFVSLYYRLFILYW